MTDYYFYPHLSKLFVANNDKGNHIRFCKNALLTINFCCVSHVDANNCSAIVGLYTNMVASLRAIIEIFNNSLKSGVHSHNIGFRLKEAVHR